MSYNKLHTVSNTMGNHHQSGSGVSLVELMISMVVGLFLLAGVVTNFIGTKDADRTRDAVSEMDANASAAFSILRPVIAHAGYPLMRSSQQYLLKTPSTKKEYYLLKNKVEISSSDLSRLFRIYTTTINLENLNKAPLGTG